MNQEVDADNHEHSQHRGIEVVLDSSSLQTAHPAAQMNHRVGDEVHRAIDQVLVDGPFDVGDEKTDRRHAVDDAVDHHVVEDRQYSGQDAGPAQDGRLVDLIDVVLVEDEAVKAWKSGGDLLRNLALGVLVESPRNQPAGERNGDRGKHQQPFPKWSRIRGTGLDEL